MHRNVVFLGQLLVTDVNMSDPMYTGEYYHEPSLGIKLEPGMDALSTSASVPIPSRRFNDLDSYFDLNTDPFNASSPLVSNENTFDASNLSDTSIWGRDSRIGTFRLDEEDIFQVEKSDLIQGPTLAELNANEEQLLTGDLNFDDLMLPGDNSLFSVPSVTMSNMETQSPFAPIEIASSAPSHTFLSVIPNFAAASSFPPAGVGFSKEGVNSSSSVPSSPMDLYIQTAPPALSPTSHHSSGSSPLAPKHSTLHELLLKREPLGRSVPAVSPPLRTLSRPRPASRLSSSAPTHLGFEQIWQRREPRQHLLSTGSLAEAGSTSSLSTGGILSPESHEFSLDEGSDSDEESDHFEYDDASSDKDSSDGESFDRERPHRSGTKKERFFWQYNVQAKGPKGQRLVLKTKQEDPHVLNEVTDPVFSPSCAVRGIKHSGKARKGDGNDLTPNPKKLQVIGKELDKLSKIINDITPVAELPFNVRPKTRKEKNKLASRACRLKKKAQHEANKIKLFGLEHEHKKLVQGIHQMKQVLAIKVNADASAQEELNRRSDRIVKAATKVKIAGHTTEYVNRVIDKVKIGVPDGGLNEF